jgi:hypothetical protein
VDFQVRVGPNGELELTGEFDLAAVAYPPGTAARALTRADDVEAERSERFGVRPAQSLLSDQRPTGPADMGALHDHADDGRRSACMFHIASASHGWSVERG